MLWTFMALLAFAVAGYAIALLSVPGLRPPIVHDLLASRPTAAIAHFAAGAVALVAGAFQFNAGLRTRFLRLHRWMGRLYLVAVATGGVSGFVLALLSSGGPAARAGFGLLALCWIGTSLNAYRHISQANVSSHRNWMIRSYALTLAAVTLRIYLPASQIAGFPMVAAYPAIAWLCWVPNLLAAEWVIRSGRASGMLPKAIRAA